MPITECPIPPSSLLEAERISTAGFWDSYRAPLVRQDIGMAELFFALFGHTPLPFKLLLVARNLAARLAGLAVPTLAQVLKPRPLPAYAVGDTIGPWPIFTLTDRELIAGRDNPHLDFRLSVLKQGEGQDGDASVTVSTVCTVHNLAGRIYLMVITPFHRWGVKQLMARAVAAGRL